MLLLLALLLILVSVVAIGLAIFLANDAEGRGGAKPMVLFMAGAGGLITCLGWAIQLGWRHFQAMPWW